MTDAIPRNHLNVPPPRRGTYDARWSNGLRALCASIVLWGLGQWIARRRRRGAMWFATWVLLSAGVLVSLIVPSFVPALLVLVPFYLILFLAMLIDAFTQGRRSARPTHDPSFYRYLAVAHFAAFALLISAAMLAGLGKALHAVGVRTLAIKTNAMEPTLMPRDRLLAHRPSVIRRWDLVIFRPPNRQDLFTQRIAGLPGEKVEIVNGQVRINDGPLASPPGIGPYLTDALTTGCAGHPIRLGVDEYFVLGDKSAAAYDSRHWPTAAPGHQLGALPRTSLVARVTAIWWPLERLHRFN